LPLQICPDDLFVTSLVSVQLPFSSCPVFVMNILDDESYLVPPMQKATFFNHSCISELPLAFFVCLPFDAASSDYHPSYQSTCPFL
jgi:hypothetical protein